MAGQAIKGFNAGGRTYGYRHIPIEDHTRLDEFGRPLIEAVRREIDPEQAVWVRRIFQWYAEGQTPRQIAYNLNYEGVPSPRGNKWAASAINGHAKTDTGFLNNELYIGRYVWNRSQWTKDPESGKRRRIKRPENEWVIKSMPELRIVPQELWEAVKKRQQYQHERSEKMRATLHKNARTGAGPKYLFSSLLKCGCCGGSYAMVDVNRYGCTTHKDRGPTACANGLKVSRKLVETRLLAAIKADLFTPEGIELFRQEVSRLLAERAKHPRADTAKTRIVSVEKEIENIMKAIKAGIVTDSTKAELQKAEREKYELQQVIASSNSGIDNIATVLPRIVEQYRYMVDNFETVTQPQVNRVRQKISALLGDKITLRPNGNGNLTAELSGDYGGLLEAIDFKVKLSLVAGAVIHPFSKGFPTYLPPSFYFGVYPVAYPVKSPAVTGF